jgi:hypothetical protein
MYRVSGIGSTRNDLDVTSFLNLNLGFGERGGDLVPACVFDADEPEAKRIGGVCV